MVSWRIKAICTWEMCLGRKTTLLTEEACTSTHSLSTVAAAAPHPRPHQGSPWGWVTWLSPRRSRGAIVPAFPNSEQNSCVGIGGEAPRAQRWVIKGLDPGRGSSEILYLGCNRWAYSSVFKKLIFIFGCAGLHAFVWASSSCSEWGLLLTGVWELLIAVASPIVESRLQACGLQ